MTKDQSYLVGFEGHLKEARGSAAMLSKLVLDNPGQRARAIQLEGVAADKVNLMAGAAMRTRADPLSSLPNVQQRMRGRALMKVITQQVGAIRNEERRLLARRTDKAQTEVREARALLLYGAPLLLLLIGSMAWMIRISVSRPLADLLDVVTRFGAGDRLVRAPTTGRSAEFRRLSAAYNAVADHLQTSFDAQKARQRSVQMLSEMAQRLQTIQMDGELSEVLDCFMPQLLPDVAGVLYVHNHSRNMLFRISSWSNPQALLETFPPADCWGLRRGQPHLVDEPGADLVCAHATQSSIERRCEPILAGGEVLGLLYIEGCIVGENLYRLTALKECVALALVNDSLRSRLREQAIRDPLTKLFNRRYMAEAFALEMARAERSNTPLSVVMCDVDHFKRFNDGNGHEAGDLLLIAVAGLIQSHFRQGDIVCRYGGEEFTVIAPGTSAALIQGRVESLRLAIRLLTIDHHGHKLGPVTMSFGIDTWSAGGDRPMTSLVAEADRALFQAKRFGRDRIIVAAQNDYPST